MTKRLVLEIDRATNYVNKPVRANISVLDEDGSGSGYRLFGPKFAGIPGQKLWTHELTKRDREELQRMLDEIDASEGS